MSRDVWLDRALVIGPSLTLCTSEAEFRSVLRRLKIKEPVPFLGSPGANATTHCFSDSGSGEEVAVVCVGDVEGCDGVQIAALLVHEAVHVWQNFCQGIGEAAPSAEFEAYSIQMIAQRLMTRFAEKVAA